ncbi:ELM2 domain protein [Opisthorchis viverrini]|uniref:ELM2 domain protein n=1 Tax=Opisthorchis viverrini TaxID=6198 RepID=A0A1S8WWT9_OPIVI|nr:ELM2 domain protein [Opisthorchis viverrini]
MSRQSTPRAARSLKTQRNQKECCSRVGPAFQAEVPELLPAERRVESIRQTAREINLWLPRKQPAHEELQEYFKTASYYKYSEELAMILLHWHGYNVSNAVDDLPNYVPISSKWTKSEVRKFLKCIDSKPRKDFVEAKKTSVLPAIRFIRDFLVLFSRFFGWLNLTYLSAFWAATRTTASSSALTLNVPS